MQQYPPVASILVVDDRPENVLALDALLEPLGQPIVKAGSGAEALRMLLKYDFAVILLDVQLQDISGFEVAEMIKQRERTRHIPIIFITAISTDFDHVRLGYSTGAVDYIAKPFNPDILRSKVAVFIDLYLKSEQIRVQAERLRINDLREAERKQREKELELERKHHIELSEAYAREKRIADVLQRSFLLAPPEGQFPGMSISTLYQAASDEANVGGDFFDAFRVGANKVALVVGDVTGKGLQAAARTAEVKYSLRAFLRDGADPRNTLMRLNPGLTTHWREDSTMPEAFVCLSVVVCDPTQGTIQCCCAGAEPPMLIRPDGGCDYIDAQGMPLGIDVESSYNLVECPVGPGDQLVMVTDGITEARRGREFFGPEGILKTINGQLRSELVNDASKAILESAREFAGGKLRDDVCVIVARYEGVSNMLVGVGPGLCYDIPTVVVS